jgi:uncharacterized membrane protein
MSEKHAPSTRVGGLVWLIGGGAAWIAAFILMLEYLAELRRQTPLISCDLSSTISCSPNQASPMGNLLGIPNSLVGLVCFTIPVVIGVASLGGTRFPFWFWRAFTAALAGATGLVLFFQFFTLTVSHVLCPNCEVVWCVTIPMFLYTTGWTLRTGAWGDAPWTRRAGTFLLSWWWVIAIAELLLALLLFQLVFNVFGL